MCEAHINDYIRQVYSVKKILTSHLKGEAVIISDEVLNEDKLKEVIDNAGYSLISFHQEPYARGGLLKKK